jgi:hypothetical protein
MAITTFWKSAWSTCLRRTVIEPHTWFELEFGVGDTRLPMRLALRLDGTVLFEVGPVEVAEDEYDGPGYDALLSVDQLEEFVSVLQIALTAAKEQADG